VRRAGVTLALHMSALPLLVGPLLLAERWADRRRFAIWTGAAFLVAFAPAWLKLPSFAKLMLNIGLHSGSYGQGARRSSTPLRICRPSPGSWPPSRWRPRSSSPARRSGSPGPLAAGRQATRRRTADLGALTATQIAGLLLTAKHPDPHYLVPIYCTLGGTLCLSWHWLRDRWPSHSARLAAPSLAALVIVPGAGASARSAAPDERPDGAGNGGADGGHPDRARPLPGGVGL
jgi:hypothetical protein